MWHTYMDQLFDPDSDDMAACIIVVKNGALTSVR
jgi:hypothetical protein